MLFRLENNVPDYYVEQSRDFQLLCRLYDLALQSSRFSINSLKTVSDTLHCNDTAIPLIGTKVGFFDTLDVVDDSTRRILSCFPYIMKYKGSIKALDMIAKLFGRVTNSEAEVVVNGQDIKLKFTDKLKDTKLFFYLIEYVRPSGYVITYEVSKYVTPAVEFGTKDTFFVGNMLRASDRKNSYADVTNTTDISPNNINISEYTVNSVGFTQIIANKDPVQDQGGQENE